MNGIIMKTENGHASVLLSNGEFRNIKDRGYFTGQKITLKNKRISIFSTIAACLLLLLGTGAVYAYPVSYVSVDINPSLELSVNLFGRVTSIRAVNSDADAIREKTGKGDVSKVVNQIITLSHENGFLEDGGFVAVSTLHPSDKTKQVLSTLQTDIPCNYLYQQSEPEDLQAAKSQGISFGKACLIRNYTSADIDGEQEEWKDAPISVIVTQGKEQKNNPSYKNEGNKNNQSVKNSENNDKTEKNENPKATDKPEKPKQSNSPSSENSNSNKPDHQNNNDKPGTPQNDKNNNANNGNNKNKSNDNDDNSDDKDNNKDDSSEKNSNNKQPQNQGNNKKDKPEKIKD